MDADRDLRESVLTTLEFFASPEQQVEFGARGYTYVYQSEFACWWFDTFVFDDPRYVPLFSQHQLDVLKRFSSSFEAALAEIGSERIEMASLLALPKWRQVIGEARKTLSEVRNAT